MRADARKNYDLLIEVARDVFVSKAPRRRCADIAAGRASEWNPLPPLSQPRQPAGSPAPQPLYGANRPG